MRDSASKDTKGPRFAGWTILWVGCPLVLIVMSFSTFGILQSLRNTEAKSDASISAFRDRAHLLDELRELMVRSALNPDSGADQALKEKDLPAARQKADQLLGALTRSLEAAGDPETERRLAELRQRLDRYWASIHIFRANNSGNPLMQVTAKGEPERKQITTIAEEIRTLNTRQQDLAQTQLHADQERLRVRFLLSSVLAMVIVGMSITGITVYIRRTEMFAEKQYESVVTARTELRRFSTQLENAREEERRELSRELHDEFGQAMAAALVELSRIQHEMTQDASAQKQLASVKAELERNMRSIRDIALLLRPSMLDDLGLVPALHWQGREVERRSGLQVRVDAEESGERLPDAYRTCIYRIVQEALHNTVRHAQASSVEIVFKDKKDELYLSIEDDGKGFDLNQIKGVGLLGIEERVRRLTGWLSIVSRPGQGTSLRIMLPAPAQESAVVK